MAEVRSELTETSGIGASLQSLGTTLTLGLTVPLVALGVASLKTFSDFDAAIRNVNSIMQLPEDQLKKLSDAVLKFGQDTRNGAQGAATALYTIVSAGFGINNTAEAMQLLAVASKTAEAGLADENSVAQLLAQSLLAYGKNADSAAHFSDVLTQTVNLGVGSMSDVAASMGQAINIAALAGESWDNLGGTAAFLTQRGMSFANAFTSINQILSQLIKPTSGLSAAFAQLGVSGGTELIAKFGGLGGALQALGTVSGTSAEDLAKLFTNVRALRGAASILGNFDQYTSLMKNFGDSISGVTDRAQQQQLLSFASQLDYLKSSITAFLTRIGEDLAPLVGKFTSFLQGLFKQLNDLDPVVIQNAVQIGLLVAAIGPLVFLVGVLLSPLGLITVALVILAKAWSDNFLGIRDAVTNLIPKIVIAFNGFVVAVNLIAFQISYALSSIIADIHTYFGDALGNFLHDVFVGNWDKAKTELGQILTDIGYFFNDKLKVPIDNAVNAIKQKIGEMLGALSPDKFVAIAVGVTVFAGALVVAAIPTLIGLITTAVQGLVAAFLVLNGIALAPFIILGIAIAGLVIAWENNFLGLKDRTTELRTTLLQTVETLKQLLFLFDYYTKGADAAKQDLANMFGINAPGTPSQDKTTPGLSATGLANKLVGSIGFGDIGKASGYNAPDINNSRIMNNSTSGHTTNNVTIVTNDPTRMLDELRRRGIDIGRYQRG